MSAVNKFLWHTDPRLPEQTHCEPQAVARGHERALRKGRVGGDKDQEGLLLDAPYATADAFRESVRRGASAAGRVRLQMGSAAQRVLSRAGDGLSDHLRLSHTVHILRTFT
jgi:hypothetical protein